MSEHNTILTNSVLTLLLRRWQRDIAGVIEKVDAMECGGERVLETYVEVEKAEGYIEPKSLFDFSTALNNQRHTKVITKERPGGLIALDPLRALVEELNDLIEALTPDDGDELAERLTWDERIKRLRSMLREDL